MLLTIVIVLLLSAACWTVGEALLALATVDSESCLAPACGLALLMSLTAGAVRLPGRGTTALIALLLLVAAATAVNLARGRLRHSPSLYVTASAGTLTTALMCIPFIVNGRFGLIGQSVGDDLGSHYAIVASLQRGFSLPLPARSAGYPLGLHSLVATVTTIVGDINQGFTAVMILIPVLTACVAVGFLRDEPPVRRVLAATLVGLPYLAAAFFAQNAFKELANGLFVLAIAAALIVLMSRRRPVKSALLVGVLTAGAVQVTGYPAVAWAGGGAVIWVTLLLLQGRRLPRLDDLPTVAPRLGWAVVGLTVPLLPSIDRIVTFNPIDAATAGNSHFLGYYFHNISGFEALGIWPIGDFRYFPTFTNTFYFGVLMGAVGLTFVLCLRWWLRDARRLAVPAVALAAGLIYAYTRRTQGPYLNAKPLAAMAPLLMLVLVRPLMAEARRMPMRTIDGAARRVFLLAFVALAGYCTLDVLDNARVGPLGRIADLMRLRPIVNGHSTLFLPEDHYVAWELAGAKLSVTSVWSIPSEVPITPRKPVIGTPVDFDAVDSTTLDHFEYVIGARTAAQSEPPPNWHLVTQTRWYSLYRRAGPTAPREILDPAGTPGAVLDCHTQAGARLAHTQGTAAVRLPPSYGAGWGGAAPGPPVLFALDGQTAVQRLVIPPGSSEISLQYQSQVPLTVSLSTGQTFQLPAYLGTFSALWRVGEVTGSGVPMTLSVKLHHPPVGIVPRSAILGTVVAVRVGERDREIPLAQACGRYVDWYRDS